MAAKLSTHFLNPNWIVINSKPSSIPSFPSSLHHPTHHNRSFSTSCKMRQRNFSSNQKRQMVKKISLKQPQIEAQLQSNGKEKGESDNVSGHDVSSLQANIRSDSDVDIMDTKQRDANFDVTEVVLSPSSDNTSSIIQSNRHSMQHVHNSNHDPRSLQQSSIPVEDLVTMIRNAEKNVLLLNQARVRAFEDLEKIIDEKESLQGEINVLEMKVAETDEKIKVAAQQKVHIELLEEQLEKMRKELSERSVSEGQVFEISKNDVPQLWNNDFHNLSKELSLLKAENMSLKDDLRALKDERSDVNVIDERVVVLEKDRLHLESTIKDLESKLAASQEDVSKLSALKQEYKSLCQKVVNLQELLNDATKQADQALLVSQQNQELHEKVDRLERSLEEANVQKLSSEKLKQYNELMQQKINILEERLQRSDEEINSYIQFYEESMKEFQDTLETLKQESGKKAAADGPVDDMPREFWSQMLLNIDGWLLEKKISSDDAKMLREMVWKRERSISDAYMGCKEKSDHELLAKLLSLTSASTWSALHVVHIAAEMAPVAKVGGLGDVVTGLGKALQKKGHLVEIILPKYDCMQYGSISNLRALDVEIESFYDGKLFKNKIWVGTVEGLPVYFIEPHHPAKFFWRGQYYGESDDFKRFSFFSRAALELLLQSGKKPDIIHCHDWQTAFVAPLYWNLYVPKGLNSARICFTCHNFEYQGAAPADEIASCGLDVYHLNRPDRMQDNSADDRINPVKGAIVFSNIVTTVSPTYAQEVRTPEGGKGLHTTLNTHSKKFIGILNGIDADSWNPVTDPYIQVQYSSSDLQGKAANKEALRKQIGLSFTDPWKPLVGCITRLVPQKGVHLIRHAIYRTMELGGQFVLLGSSPVHHIQREFESIASQFQYNNNARLILKYDESLSRSIYAACDIFIIPSIFEPCGLTQMIAMRYGSIPVARKTGGLNDSVFDVDDEAIPLQFRNGFTFISPDEQGLNSALDRALNLYINDREGWEQLVKKVMSMDFSWESSAVEYEQLYASAVARAKALKQG